MVTNIEKYQVIASSHGKFTAGGDSDKANCAYDELQKVYWDIVNHGESNKLFDLYCDDDPWVQCWAAIHTLEIHEETALSKLEQIVKLNYPIVSTTARYTIQEWKLGNLHFIK